MVHTVRMCVCVCAHVCVDSDSEMIPDSSTDETVLSSIDKLSDACVMRYISLVSCSVELGH